MEKIDSSELATLPSYETAIQALKDACDNFAQLRHERDSLAADKDHAISALQFETHKHHDLVTDLEASRSILESSNSQLANLYSQVLNTQKSLVIENTKLLKDIEVLRELSNVPFSMEGHKDENLLVTQSLSQLAESTLQGIQTKIEHQNASDHQVISSLIDANSQSHSTLNHAILELARNQSIHFRNKIEAVMTISEALIGRMGKPEDVSESCTLGKRSTMNSTGHAFEVDRLSSKTEKLLAENKFLVYVIECFQQKIAEKQIAFPKNFLNLEFLLKNQNFLAKTDSPLFVSIDQLYDLNERLTEQLRMYKRSSYLNPSSKGPQSLDELKNEFQIIAEKAKLDHEHELRSLSLSLTQKVQEQERIITDQQKQIIEAQTTNKNKEAYNQLLASRLEVSEVQVKQLQEKINQLEKDLADYVARVNAKIEKQELPAMTETNAIDQFYEGVMQSTSTLFTILSQSTTSEYKSRNTTGYVDALIKRLNDENRNLRCEISRKEAGLIDLAAEKEALVQKIATIETETKKEDARELVKDLVSQVQDRTQDLDKLRAESDEASLKNNQLVQEMKTRHLEKLFELEELQRMMKTNFEMEVSKAHNSFEERLTEVKQKYESERQSLELNLSFSKSVIQSLQAQVQSLEIELVHCKSSFAKEHQQFEQETSKSVALLQAQLTKAQYDANTKQNAELKKLKENIQDGILSHQEAINQLKVDHEKEINRLLEKIKTLEHTLEIVHFNRDNILGVIENAYANKTLGSGSIKYEVEKNSEAFVVDLSNVLV